MIEAAHYCLGFDAGSVALKVVITDARGNLIEQVYQRSHGRPLQTALAVFDEIGNRYPGDAFRLVAGTGSAGRLICELLGAPFVNEVICQATAVAHLHSDCRTLLEMGGQDSKLIFLAPRGNGQLILDFATNSNCAAGTGSFLDQQASRLGVRIEEEFGRLALASRSVPRVAGRCSVFAKSDMIHLQQQAASVSDIVAGLCFGLVRNLKSNLSRGLELPRPVAFCGGVAANQGVIRAMREVFSLAHGDLIVPDCHASTGALGAVLVVHRERSRSSSGNGHAPAIRLDTSALRARAEQSPRAGQGLSPLARPAAGQGSGTLASAATDLVDAYLGLDVGSISTKAAVIDDQGRLLAKTYLMTAGRPLEAVRCALREIGQAVGGRVKICGAATTGSGRQLTGDFIGADLVINEITAQATAAAAIDPDVDTVFEIGGQDSKYIRLDRGVVVDFEMNHACAAGTGSFLEEQAERLGVDIRTQFAELALRSRGPTRLGERCTVFMESDLISHQQQGAAVEDLAAGLCYSIAGNYLHRVVGQRSVGRKVFFQGGTAFNRAVVAAFDQALGRPVTVPPHHEVTGAIGAALLAQRRQRDHGQAPSRFGGFALAEQQAAVRTFACPACSNACEVNEVTVPDRRPLCYGARCDRYDARIAAQRGPEIPDLFAERQRLLLAHARLHRPDKGATTQPRPKIGLPLTLSNYQLLPFWGTLLDALGFDVALSSTSTRQVIRRGVDAVLAATCFPVKVAHGHVLELVEQGVDAIWLPSVLTLHKEHAAHRDNQPCPYVTALPYLATAVLEGRGARVKLLQPPVRFQEGPRGVWSSLKPFCSELGVAPRRLRRAIVEAWRAQDDFEDACRARGREVLAGVDAARPAVVIVGRAYNTCDPGVCLDLPKKLRQLGVLPIPMDFLDLRPRGLTGDRLRDEMYWKSGRAILRTAEIVRDDPRLNAVYLTNFGCGPDSFLLGYFKRLCAPRPVLTLEIDEHSADAGLVTRLEAFLESLRHNQTAAERPAAPSPVPAATSARRKSLGVLYVPWMGDYSCALAAAFRAYDVPAEVIPRADQASLEEGRRHCSGKECLPFLITAGDMVRIARRPDFDRQRSAFFMPRSTGPCRFGQYGCAQRAILDDLGLRDVPIFSPSQNQGFYDQWAEALGRSIGLAWHGVCAVDMLLRARLALRPYETPAGQVDALYQDWSGCLYRELETRPTTRRLAALLAEAAAAFARLEIDRRTPRPRIGVVGEIYVRLHDFANNNIVRQLESLGAETALEGFPEWVLYLNWVRKQRSLRESHWREWLVNAFQDGFQRRVQRRLAAPFARTLGIEADSPTAEVVQLARPYLHSTLLGGEAVLSAGKMVEFHRQGCHGVVNVMPFGCMPSTIVSGITRKLSRDLGNMPILSVSYDGQQDPTLQTRLEAFLHQAREHQAQQPLTALHMLAGRRQSDCQ